MTRSKAVPDRWLDYHTVGGIIPGTRFISFKVPLQESICSRLPTEARFTPSDLLQRVYGLGLIIDLTCTNRYYDRDFILRNGIYHAKIVCAGQQIPHAGVVGEFFETVDRFLMDPRNNGKLIGVHCTHGVNRTGYLVCRYMIEKLGVPPDDAIREFECARGHRFDRDEYVRDLRVPRNLPWTSHTEQSAGYAYGTHWTDAGQNLTPPVAPLTAMPATYEAPLPPLQPIPPIYGSAVDYRYWQGCTPKLE
ncbi:RNA/RNP complex-1-interacting phosphatase [Ixodes scapularis]|nr:RNA/RNP complex-1-interacting phosphatase [Ixodes scapularis]